MHKHQKFSILFKKSLKYFVNNDQYGNLSLKEKVFELLLKETTTGKNKVLYLKIRTFAAVN